MSSHGVWLYFRFCLSYRDVEALMAERGVILTYEAVRYWCRKFGPAAAKQSRRRPQLGDKWHLAAGFLTSHGKHQNLWRAGDQDGRGLAILVQRRREKKAAPTFLRKRLQGVTYLPRVLITAKLKSYGAATQEILPGVKHRQHRSLTTRVENCHHPTRQRERRRQRFMAPGHAQRFLAASGPLAQDFRPRRPRLPACEHRHTMGPRCHIWREFRGQQKP
jgi:putative transposase